MARKVPLATRQQLAEPRRLMATAAAVGLSIMLILLLDGLWTGITRSVTAYEDNAGADLYVAQPGTRNFLGASSQLPISTLATVRATEGVDWAAPVRTYLAILDRHGRKLPTAVVGWEPGQRGGPWVIRSGRAPAADNEIAIGPVLAEQHGLRIGQDLQIMGRPFTIVGTSSDTFMVSFAFMTHDAADALIGASDTTSFVLVGTRQPETVRRALGTTGLAVLDRREIARHDLASVTRAYKVPMNVMRVVAFSIGSVVIALSGYTAIIDRKREYGIVKAIGASRRDLLSIAVRQTAILTALGLGAGAALFVIGRTLIIAARPQFQIVATGTASSRAAMAALFMGAVAAAIPAQQLARLEPAAAYRGSP